MNVSFSPGLDHTGLVNWLDRTNLVAGTGGVSECLVDMGTNAPACFYRLRGL